MNKSLAVFTSEGLAIREGKTGAIRAAFITRKDFGIARALKGAALKRAHDSYRHEFSQKMGGEVCRHIGNGSLHVTAITQNSKANGYSIRAVTDLRVTNTSKEKELRDKLAAMEQAFLAYKAANPAPVGA